MDVARTESLKGITVFRGQVTGSLTHSHTVQVPRPGQSKDQLESYL
jgi:hypothetical protein